MTTSEDRCRCIVGSLYVNCCLFYCIALSQCSFERQLLGRTPTLPLHRTMATPPGGSSIFLSSSPARYSSDPSGEVDLLLARARTIQCLNPTTESFIATNRTAFFNTFERRINLIKSRSQAFQDSHVTVFDKVLLQLTQNGGHLDHTAAIQYFCEEFLAIPTDISNAQQTAILSDAIVASMRVLPGEMFSLLVVSPDLTDNFKL